MSRLDEDLRDVFKLMYEDEGWISDEQEEDEGGHSATLPAVTNVTELEEVDPSTQYLERYSRKRFMTDLDALLGSRNDSKKRRIYGTASIASSSSIPCSSPFPQLPPPTTYAPYSPLPLLARLRTFQSSSYSSAIPFPLDPVQAVLNGWINTGRETISCGLCKAKWDMKGVVEIREDKVRIEVARRLGPGLANKHKQGCAWKIRKCPDSLPKQLRQTLHPPITSNIILLADRLEYQCVGRANSDFRWTSPLSDSQLNILTRRYPPLESVSTLSAALAVFCWYPYHPNEPAHTLSQSDDAKTDIVQCRLCERRVGLWSFRTEKERDTIDISTKVRLFDLVEEHLAWCPIKDQAAQRKWWGHLSLMGTGVGKDPDARGWIRVSEKMGQKSWRRSRV